jgi:aminoglycoside N3'-acetyltransferase
VTVRSERAPDALVADLQRLGVVTGDVLMVHASLRAIGPVKGGAAGVIVAIDTAIGRNGSWLMTLGARDSFGWVNEMPEAIRPDILRWAVPFDTDRTPADPDNGVLAEVFRRHPGTVVNHHPEGRFGARGRLASALVADPPWDDYYGSGSPLERLVAARGKVLRLGADPDTVTLLHHAEYLADVADKRRVRRHRLVVAGDHTELRTVECLDDSDGIAEHPGEDYFETILRAYLATDRGARGRVGDASCELLDAADLVEFGAAWMSANLNR